MNRLKPKRDLQALRRKVVAESLSFLTPAAPLAAKPGAPKEGDEETTTTIATRASDGSSPGDTAASPGQIPNDVDDAPQMRIPRLVRHGSRGGAWSKSRDPSLVSTGVVEAAGDGGDVVLGVVGPAQRSEGAGKTEGNAGGHAGEDIVGVCQGEGGGESWAVERQHESQDATAEPSSKAYQQDPNDDPATPGASLSSQQQQQKQQQQKQQQQEQEQEQEQEQASSSARMMQDGTADRRPKPGKGEREVVISPGWCLLDALVGEAWDRVCGALDARAIGRLGATCLQMRGMAGGQALWQELCWSDWGREGWAEEEGKGGVSIGSRVVTRLRGQGRRLDQFAENALMQAKVTSLAGRGEAGWASDVSPLDGLPMDSTVGSKVGGRGSSGIDWRATYASMASMEGLGLLFEARSVLAAPQAGQKKSEAACACMALTARYVSWKLSGPAGSSHRLISNGTFLPHSLVLSASFQCSDLGGRGGARHVYADIPGVGKRKVGEVNMFASGGGGLPHDRGVAFETGGQGDEGLPAVVVLWKAPGKNGLVDMCTVHVTVSLSTMCRSVHVCSTWAPSLCIHRPKAAASRPPAPAQVWMRVQLAGIDGGGDEGVGTRRSKLWEWHTPCTRGYAANPISSLGREGASTGERYLFRNNFTPNGTGGTTPFEVGAGASIFSFQFAVGPCGQEGAGAAEAKGGGGGWGHVAWHVSGLCCPVSSESGGDVGDFVAEVRGVGGNSAEEAGEHGLPPGWTRFIEPAGEVYMHVTGKKTNSRPAWGDEGVHRGGKHGQAQGGGRGPCFRIAFDQSSSAGGGAVGMALRVKWFECEMDVR